MIKVPNRLSLLLRYIFLNLWLVSVSFNVSSQPSLHPEKWKLDESRSDEFDSDHLDDSKWWKLNYCAYTDSISHGFIGNHGAVWNEEYVTFDHGNIIFKTDYNPDSANLEVPCKRYFSYPFYSGGIVSILTDGGPGIGEKSNYSYGYYEMRAKLPGYYNSQHEPVGYGFFPTFWIFYQRLSGRCIEHHDEIDILEPSPEQYYDGRTNVFGVHDESNDCNAYKVIEDSVKSTVPLFQEYHTFGMEFSPAHIIFYLNDEIVYSADTLTSPSLARTLNMLPYLAVEMNLQMGGQHGRPYPYPETPFPQYMYVDYFRYYQPVHEENRLLQNFPNPVAAASVITYEVKDLSKNPVLRFYDARGKFIKAIPINEQNISGITILNSEFSPGIYFYSLIIENVKIASRRFVVIE